MILFRPELLRFEGNKQFDFPANYPSKKKTQQEIRFEKVYKIHF